MHVLFIAPYPLDVPGGNSTALVRLVAELTAASAQGAGPPFRATVAT